MKKQKRIAIIMLLLVIAQIMMVSCKTYQRCPAYGDDHAQVVRK